MCTQCPVDTYKNSVSDTACINCRINSQLIVASTDISRCICNAGYYLLPEQYFEKYKNSVTCTAGTYRGFSAEVNVCTPCEAGKYVAGVANSQCISCPTNSGSVSTGNTALASCMCLPSFTGTATACSACGAGKFKPGFGSVACTSCPAAKYSYADTDKRTDCISCVASRTSPVGSDESQDCVCVANTYEIQGTVPCTACVTGATSVMDSATCTCSVGKKWVSASNTCIDCPANSKSSGGITPCVCNAGFNGIDDGACTMCAVNSMSTGGNNPCVCNAGYKGVDGSGVCDKCAVNSMSFGGNTVCLCNRGYTGPDGGTCSICPPLAYKNLLGSSDCLVCNADYVTFSVYTYSTQLTVYSCIPCTAAKFKNDNACLNCAANTYKTAEMSGACVSCVPFSTSAVGSTLQNQCLCNSGYTGQNGDTCAICESGTYKASNGNSSCVPCPPLLASPSGSTNQDACVGCVAGKHEKDGKCVDCVAGKYESDGKCVDCSIGQFKSTPARTNGRRVEI